jgi:hypothetical protein
MNQVTESFLTLYCDPGEDFGMCLANGTKLLAARTEKMWTVAREIHDAIEEFGDAWNMFKGYERSDVEEDELKLPIGRIVCEDWRLYPDKLQELAWDPCRTARVIGAVTLICLLNDVTLIFQGANIKKAAQAAGAEELYYKPVRENRHQNDAIQHFVFYSNVELMDIPLPVPDSVRKETFV